MLLARFIVTANAGHTRTDKSAASMIPICRDLIQSHRGHTMLGFTPGSEPLVIDCGAHKGEFATAIHAAWRARCHSVEASPRLYADLVLPPGAIGYNFAVSGSDGEVSFALNDNPEASHVGSGNRVGDFEKIAVPARSLAGFLDEVSPGDIDLLKLDIEGSEIAALQSLDERHLARIGQITAEFHDFCGYVTSSEVDASIARLRDFGFAVFSFSFHTRGDVLMVNQSLHPLSAIDRFRIGQVERYRRGFARVLQRKS